MEKDLLLKRYLCDNDRFADLLNGIVGEQLVEPENLTELDTQTGVFSVLRNRFGRNKRQGKQGHRDLLKKAAFGVNFLVVGIENQESVHYLMPLRCMSYDAGEYERQAAHIKKKVRKMPDISSAEFLSGFTKESKLNPCITLVLYFGEDWDGPRKLSDIIDFTEIPEKFRYLVNDYPMYVLEIQKLKNTEMFKTDLKQVFDCIRLSKEPEKFSQLVANDPVYETLDEDAYDVIAEYTDIDELKEIKDVCRKRKGEKKVNMCYAWQVIKQEEREKGQEIEREKGVKALCKTCRDFGISREDVAKKLVENMELSKEQAEEYVKKFY